MSFKFQLPPITADMSVDRMRSYLMQMQDQLEYALNNLETSNFTETTKQELSKNSAAISQEVVEASEEVSKAFVLKNAEEIREEMQTYVQSITGQYEAISEQFGTYREETDLKIETNANGITQNYNKVTALETSTNNAIAATNAEVTSQGDVIDATTAWKRLTQAYIKTGLLYYEGLTPVYGIAIGQINIDENDPEECMIREGFYATYTGSDIVFYKGTTEVARYSDIEAIVNQLSTNRIVMGNFTISVDADGFTIR